MLFNLFKNYFPTIIDKLRVPTPKMSNFELKIKKKCVFNILFILNHINMLGILTIYIIYKGLTLYHQL